MSNLSFGILLAPYRVDYYNYLHDECNFDIWFQQSGFKGQLFDSAEIEKKSTYSPKIFKNINLGKRRIAVGLRKIIRNAAPEIVIVPEFSLIAFEVIVIRFFSCRKFKVVSQCDDSIDMLTGGKSFSRVHSMSRKLLIHSIDNLILLDEKSTDWYQKKYGKGVWMPLISKRHDSQDELNKVQRIAKEFRFGINPANAFQILFVGRMVEVKNFPVLALALKDFPEPYSLVVLGDGPCRKEWMELSEKYGLNAHFPGKKEGNELMAAYYSSDVLVLPSIVEPFGAVVNEALQMGCRCIVSEIAGSACLIDVGHNGYIVNPKSSTDIKEKLITMMKMPFPERGSSLMRYNFEDCITAMWKNLKEQ